MLYLSKYWFKNNDGINFLLFFFFSKQDKKNRKLRFSNYFQKNTKFPWVKKFVVWHVIRFTHGKLNFGRRNSWLKLSWFLLSLTFWFFYGYFTFSWKFLRIKIAFYFFFFFVFVERGTIVVLFELQLQIMFLINSLFVFRDVLRYKNLSLP